MTPLQHAVFSGNLPIVRFLLDHGADLHQEGSLGGHDRCTALHTAAEKGINTKRTSLIYSLFSQDMCWFPVQSLLLPSFSLWWI